MKKLTAEAAETKSSDLIAENIQRLKELFPELVTEGANGVAINTDMLKQLVGDRTVTDADETFGLNWHGKRRARKLALTLSTGTLRPCPEDSITWDKTQNLIIEGDNLEVLKLLQKSYAGKVKLIVIDPPYNTGKDFVYPDDYRDNIRNYLQLTGQVEEGRKITSDTEVSGRFHTDWLNMMYPRLKVARALLQATGVIFVTIDDSESANLRLALDDVFGPENFIASIAWKKRSSPDARDTVGYVHDWILCYVKDASKVKSAIGKIPLSKERVDSYSNPDDDPRGDWASVDMTGMTGRATEDQYFKVTLPSGRVIGPPPGRSWGLVERTFNQLRTDNRIWFGKNGDSVPRIKKFLSESDGQAVPSFWDMTEVGSNDDATAELTSLMGRPGVFDTPKPLALIERMVQISTQKSSSDIVLDFFAGSGTTGHAVLKQNATTGGNRRYILVQLPGFLDPERRDQKTAAEFCDQLGKPRNIAELTKERLRRAAQQVKEENPQFAGDLGFRAFRLDSSNIREWEPRRDDLAQTLLEQQEHLKTDRSERDILYELLLKRGLDLCVPIETKDIAGKAVHSIGGGVLITCLAERITAGEVEKVGQGIAAWHKSLAPAGDTTCVFRDDAFADDVAKTNLAAILNQNGLLKVQSL